MKIATFQFCGSHRIENNYDALKRGIEQASRENIRFLLTQECALCGYPPVETKSVTVIDFHLLEHATAEIKKLARHHQMYIGLGTIIPRSGKYTNSIVVLSPNEQTFLAYDKRALWGWDRDNFIPGTHPGVYAIDGIRIGLRICYEIRFPEYFRELFKAQVQIACVSLCDNSDADDPERYEILKSHFVTRAIENTLFVISSNTISKRQTAPTAIINPDGKILRIAPQHEEDLLSVEVDGIQPTFGRNGRIRHSKELLGIS
jgi:omega-amidase